MAVALFSFRGVFLRRGSVRGPFCPGAIPGPGFVPCNRRGRHSLSGYCAVGVEESLQLITAVLHHFVTPEIGRLIDTGGILDTMEDLAVGCKADV